MPSRSLLLSFFFLLLPWQARSTAPRCESTFQSFNAQLIRARTTGSRIFKLQDGRYFKEESKLVTAQDQVFSDDRMGALVYQYLKHFGAEKYVAQTEKSEGLSLVVDGKMILTKPGIIQEGRDDITTPLDDYHSRHLKKAENSAQLHDTLNQKEWDRHYANWKLLWMLLHQTDLSIENMGISKGRVFIFDVGDALVSDSLRCQFGVCDDRDYFVFNFPKNASDRVYHAPDFRLADPELKELVIRITKTDVPILVKELGSDFNKELHDPRDNAEKLFKSMQKRALRIRSLLNKSPEL